MKTILMLILLAITNLVSANDYDDFNKHKKTCALDDGLGCSNLGAMYELGNGIRQSKHKALEYYDKACDMKIKPGCKNYARLNQ